MINKTKEEITNFEKKVLFNINNGFSGYDVIIHFIENKTYGSFRTISKNVKETTEKLLTKNLITKNEYDKIFEAIKNKTKTKTPTINFDLNKFYEYYFFKENKNNELLDTLFICLPFLYTTNFKELSQIRISKIDTFKVTTGLVIRWYINQNEMNSIIMNKYDDLWLKKYEILKLSATDDFLFNKFFSSSSIQAYTQLNLDFHVLLKDFITGNSSKLKYITEIKNALKYSSNSIFKAI